MKLPIQMCILNVLWFYVLEKICGQFRCPFSAPYFFLGVTVGVVSPSVHPWGWEGLGQLPHGWLSMCVDYIRIRLVCKHGTCLVFFHWRDPMIGVIRWFRLDTNHSHWFFICMYSWMMSFQNESCILFVFQRFQILHSALIHTYTFTMYQVCMFCIQVHM